MLDTIIFDAEGVVLNTETLWDKAQEIFLARRNISYDRDKIKHLLAGKSLIGGTKILKDMYFLPQDMKALLQERKVLIEELFHNGVSFIEGFEFFFLLLNPNIRQLWQLHCKENYLIL